jgi:hypothetical protein
MTATSSGNVGIGTSSPGALLDVSAAGTAIVKLTNRNSGATEVVLSLDAGGNGVSVRDSQIRGGNSGGNLTYLSFYTSPAATPVERVRIDANGRFLIGTTNPAPAGASANGQATILHAGGGTTNGINIATTATSSRAIEFQYTGFGVTGFISTATSTTAYNTSSDYRLKNTVAPMTGALAKVALLKPCTYKWNSDGSDGQGFIAHELAEVEPGCVTGEKDAVDAEGNPQYQGIDTSFLVATLTAAIQEQQAIITAQNTTINALTARVEALENT